MLKTPIGRLRAIGLVEGASYLALLGIAMPLKYFAGLPIAVRVVGMIHGVLFVAFCAALAHVFFATRWSVGRALLAFVASLLPFGTFVIDGRLKREDAALQLAKEGAQEALPPAAAQGATSSSG